MARGWHGEPRRHGLARKGIKTVLPDGRRLDVSKFVARGSNYNDFDDFGYKMATGKLGTGWMAFWIGDIDEVLAESVESDDTRRIIQSIVPKFACSMALQCPLRGID